MNKRLLLACVAVSGLALAGCATRAPDTTAMGAAAGCDLRVDVGQDHRCVVSTVSPADDQMLLTNGMHTFESRIVPRQPEVITLPPFPPR